MMVVVGVWRQVRRSHFLLRLCEAAGSALQPKGEEHFYLSSRRNINP
jgi:hypothetical protein